MTTPRPHRTGATTNPTLPPVELDADLSSLDVIGLKELQHRIEAELARIEPSEPPDASRGQLAQHGHAPADPERSRGLRALLIAIDDRLVDRTDTTDQPTGE
jgi:hypothetical protein